MQVLCHYCEAIWLGQSLNVVFYVRTKWKCVNFPDLSLIYICLSSLLIS